MNRKCGVRCVVFVCRVEGVRRGSFCNKRTCLPPTSVTTESYRCFFFGGGLWCLALTRMSHRLLKRQKDRILSERHGIGSERFAGL